MTDVRFAMAISLDREHESPILLNRARSEIDFCTMLLHHAQGLLWVWKQKFKLI